MLVGYYNGGYVRTLDVDTKVHRPEPDPSIDEAIAWMESRPDLFCSLERPEPGVQITMQMRDLAHPERFSIDAQECPAVREGRVRIERSAHSLDIVVSRATKMNVVRMVADGLPMAKLCCASATAVPGMGMITLYFRTRTGISVGDVCGAPRGCWSLFGSHITGPRALLKVPSRPGPIGDRRSSNSISRRSNSTDDNNGYIT